MVSSHFSHHFPGFQVSMNNTARGALDPLTLGKERSTRWQYAHPPSAPVQFKIKLMSNSFPLPESLSDRVTSHNR